MSCALGRRLWPHWGVPYKSKIQESVEGKWRSPYLRPSWRPVLRGAPRLASDADNAVTQHQITLGS